MAIYLTESSHLLNFKYNPRYGVGSILGQVPHMSYIFCELGN